MSEKEPDKFPNIPPPNVVIPGARYNYIYIDFQTKEDIEDLIRLIFDESECAFYYYKEESRPLNPLLNKAMEAGDILFTKYEDYFYLRPTEERM